MDKRTCSIDGCELDYVAKGYCRQHYNHWYSHGNPVSLTAEVAGCKVCGGPIPPKGKTGPRSHYCSAACRLISHRPRAKEHRDEKVAADREAGKYRCQFDACGVILAGRENRWCAAHLIVTTAARRMPDNLKLQCSEDSCERPVRARKLCSMHWGRVRDAEVKRNNPWNDRRRNNDHLRRARKAGNGKGSRSTIADIITRDGTNCSWCGEDVDLDLAYPDKLSKSVDHTIPISRGGPHTLENTSIMHLQCNMYKGANIPISS